MSLSDRLQFYRFVSHLIIIQHHAIRGVTMLNTLRKVCGIEKEKFYINLDNVGNTVSSTILIGLKDCLERQIIKPNDTVMIAGFGVGLSWGGTILRF